MMSSPAPGSLVDMHVHTRHKSLDSGMAPDDMARRAKETGLTAVCVTEHNNIWTAEEAASLGEAFGIHIIRGMEISTDIGHVLVFGLEAYTLEMMHVDRLRTIALHEGAVMVLAHPTRPPGFRRPWHEATRLFEALECYNGDDHNRSNEYLIEMAAGLKLGATGGSDAHTVQGVARRATLFEDDVRDVPSLIDAIRGGRYRPVIPSAFA